MLQCILNVYFIKYIRSLECSVSLLKDLASSVIVYSISNYVT